MAWIELHQSLVNHRKTLAAADMLGISPVYMVGHLTAFWLWAIDNAPQGRLEGVTEKTIARAAQWEGQPADFVGALEAVGFLEQDGEAVKTLVIHDWYDYAGKLVERRAANAERMRKERATHVQRTCSVGDARTCEATVPNRTVPNSTLETNVSGAKAPTATAAKEIFEYYRLHIQPNARFLDAVKAKIKGRLRAYKAEDLRDAVDKFAASPWWMEHNGNRGAAWFFESDPRIEQFINLKPDAPSRNGQHAETPTQSYPEF